MPTRPPNRVVHHVYQAVARDGKAGPTDAQLVESFATRKDEAAFEALLRRHGPMVLGVCRRVLNNHHDAEDAFQATFLVLARKAGSVKPRAAVANWLYGVAHTTALKARAMAAKRREKERQALPRKEAEGQGLWDDLLSLLDHELSRLPGKYRLLVVLCDLEGKTRKAAARQLGLPEGTISSRLSRGRALLAKRLRRHGLAVTASTLAGVLSLNAVSACVPSSLLASTAKAGVLLAAGQAAGMVSAQVTALTKGVMKAMVLSKLKVATVLLAALGLVGAGAGLLAFGTVAADNPPAQAQTPQNDNLPDRQGKAGQDPEEARLVNELGEAAGKEWQTRMEEFKVGKGTQEFLYASARRLLKAELEKAHDRAERVAAREAHLARMATIEKINAGRFREGTTDVQNYQGSRFWRVEAELELKRARK